MCRFIAAAAQWYTISAWLAFVFSSLPFLFVPVLLQRAYPPQNPAPSPPLGWNSWDAYGLTINEADYRANATVLAQLRQFGWEYAVIDEGWYMQDPFANTSARPANISGTPTASSFPRPTDSPPSANGAGFKPLADWVHAKGLKFGIHIVRGIPRQVVKAEPAHRRLDLSCRRRSRH